MAIVACAAAAAGVAAKSEKLGLPFTSRPVDGAVGRCFMAAVLEGNVALGVGVLCLFILPFVFSCQAGGSRLKSTSNPPEAPHFVSSGAVTQKRIPVPPEPSPNKTFKL